MTRDAIIDFVKDFGKLDDDNLVPPQATEVLLGGLVSPRQLRRKPPIPRRQISRQRFGFRAGDIRALIRGEFQIEPSVSPRHHSRKGKFSQVAESA
jgi:hypothetical protein